MKKRSRSIAAKMLFFALPLLSPTIPPLKAQERLPVQTLTFSSKKWTVRQTLEPEGPADNMFGGRDLSVILDKDGALTLTLAYKEGIWYAGEVTLQQRTGYGTYLFKVRTPPGELDPNIVLGLFTYSGGAAYSHREIDIEFSAWGQRGAPILGQYVIQPYETPGHIETFGLSSVNGPGTYSFTWAEGKVDFASWTGYGPRPEAGSPSLISSWTFADPKAVPKPSPNVHINLYLADGSVPPSGHGSLAVTIDAFEFIPGKK